MLEKIKALILDSQQAELITGARRQIRIVSVAGKATVCMGVRRSGKSTLMYQIMSDRRAQALHVETASTEVFFEFLMPSLVETLKK
jgi:hypothetical protein